MRTSFIQRQQLFLIAFVLLLFAGASFATAKSPKIKKGLYAQQIHLADGASETMQEAAKELANWLEEITGKTFTISQLETNAPAPEAGIILSTIDADCVPELLRKKLAKEEYGEAFMLDSVNAKRLWIIGKQDMAVPHGVYKYLELLGCRWYYPTEAWTIIPKHSGIVLKLNLLEAPAFRSRGILYTGGFGGVLPLDPREKVKKLWYDWEKRNRWGGDIVFNGHAYDVFNSTHREVLQAHPEYKPELNGKRVANIYVGMKLCYSNPEVQRIFAEWAVKTLETSIKRYGENDPRCQSVSVDPSDGGGHCECVNCKKLGNGTASDGVYTLANAAARAVEKKYPGRFVNLLGYNLHARTPSFDVEPNVFVKLCPNGWPNAGLNNEDFLAKWDEKLGQGRVGMYRYWGMIDWYKGFPDVGIDWANELPKKIRFWNESGVVDVSGQFDPTAGNMGPAYVLMSRMLWDPSLDDKDILDDFYSKCFGKAKIPMKTMLERWSVDYTSSDHELGLSYANMAEAYKLCDDQAVRLRLDDYARYLHYIRVFYEFKELPLSEKAQIKATELLEYIWRIYDTTMISGFRTAFLMRYMIAPNALYEVIGEWDTKLGYYDSDVWPKIKPVSAKEAKALLADGLAKYKPKNFIPRDYSKKLVPLKPAGLINEDYMLLPINNSFNAIFASGDSTQVKVRIMCGKPKIRNDYPGHYFKVFDSKDKIVFEKRIPPNGEMNTLTIPVKKNSTYKMTLYVRYNTCETEIPSNLPFVIPDEIVNATEVYFYVPKGTKQIVASLPISTPAARARTKIFAPDEFSLKDKNGKVLPVKMDTSDVVVLIDVKPGADGQMWKLNNYKFHKPLKFLNIPSNFSYSKETMLVPESVVSGRN